MQTFMVHRIFIQYFWSSPDGQSTDRKRCIPGDAYEPIMQSAQVGSKIALVIYELGK